MVETVSFNGAIIILEGEAKVYIYYIVHHVTTYTCVRVGNWLYFPSVIIRVRNGERVAL